MRHSTLPNDSLYLSKCLPPSQYCQDFDRAPALALSRTEPPQKTKNGGLGHAWLRSSSRELPQVAARLQNLDSHASPYIVLLSKVFDFQCDQIAELFLSMWPSTTMKTCPAKVRLKFCQILYKHSKNYPILLNLYQCGKISPYRVTLSISLVTVDNVDSL